MPNTPDLTDLFDKPNPRTRVHSIASKAGLPPDIADDYLRLTKIESGHNTNVRDSSKGAQGFGQVMPDVKGGTTRTVGGKRYNLRNADENIEAGIRYFAEGGNDPVARRLHYFGGPKAKQRYERTGKMPNISDGNMTAAQYVKATGGNQKPQSASPDLSDLFDKPSGQTQPATSKQNRVNNLPPTPATTPVSSRQQSVPKQPIQRRGPTNPFDFQRPAPRLEVGAKVGGPQASQGVGDLRRQDERDLARMSRIRGQVTSEQTDAEQQMGRAPNTAQARLFDPKLNVDEEVLKRISQEQDTEKAQADAQAEQQRLIGQFTDADRAEIADFTNHLQGKGGVYSGIRAGIRRGGSSALYKLAGLAEIGNQVAKRTVGESWIPDYLRKKALAGELSVNDIPEDKRNQLAEFLAQSGVGLAELAAAPGSITTKFAGMAGSEALGRNLPAKEVARETAKGAAMGAVQKYGEGLAPASAGRFKRAAVSAPAVGIGSGAVELATGATPREAALSAVTNAAFQGGGEMLRRTPQRRLSEAEAAPKQEVNVPERPETIAAQLAAVQQGTRPAVLVTRGEKQPNTPRGMSAVRTSEGTFYYDPKQVSRETLLAKVKDGTYGEVLGHIEPKSAATTEAVVARAADGTEVQASAVSPENVAKQAEVLQAQHPEATIETGGNELAQKVIQDRVAPEVRGFDDVPLTERERAELDTYFDVESRIPESERVPPKPAKIDILGETEVAPKPLARRELLELTDAELDVRESPVPKGMTRLYRGGVEGNWFSSERDTARFHLDNATGRKPTLRYVDVPTADLAKYDAFEHPRVVSGREQAEAGDYILPKELTAQARDLATETAPTEVAPIEPVVAKPKTPVTETPVTPETPRAATEPREPSTTSARKAQMAQDRAELDLPELDPTERKTWRTTLDNAKERGLDKRGDMLADEVLKKRRALDDEETAGVVLRTQELKNQHNQLLKEIAESKDEVDILRKGAELKLIEDRFDLNSEALKESGGHKGRALAAQKLTINQDYDLISLVNRAKAAKGRDITPAERERYEKQDAEIKRLTEELSKAEERASVANLQKQVERVARRRTRTETKATLDDEFVLLTQEFRAKMQGVQPLGIDPTAIPVIAKMAHNRVKAGVTDVAQLVDDIHGAVSEHLPDITKRDIRDAISGYGITAELSQDQVKKSLREMKSIMRLASALEDAEAKQKPLRSGLQREADTPQVKELRRQLNEKLKEAGLLEPREPLPPKQGPKLSEGTGPRQGPTLREGVGRKQGPRVTDAPLQGPKESDARRLPMEGPKITDAPKVGPKETLEAIKKRVNVQIDEYQRRLDEGDFSPRSKQPRQVIDTPETRRLKDQLAKIKNEYERELERDRGMFWHNMSGIRKSWMLSGIRTQARNIAGTAGYQVFDEIARMPAVIADAAVAPITGQRSIAMSNPIAMLDSVVKGAKAGAREFKETMQFGGTREQMERMQIKEINTGSQAFDLAHNVVFRLMSGSDRVFYNIAYERALLDRATVQAKNEKASNVRARAKEIMDTASPHGDLVMSAKHDALINTFNNNNKLSDAIKRARGTLGPKANFAIDLVLPFDRTPTNVVTRILEAAPVSGQVMTAVRAGQMAKGIINKSLTLEQQRQFAQTFGRSTAGTALAGLGWALMPSGIITTDDYGNAFLNVAGKQINLSTISPAGNIIAMGANMWKAAHSEKDQVRKGIGAVAKPLSDIPLVRSTTGITEAVKNPARSGTQFAGHLASSFVPFGGLQRDAALVLDPEESRKPKTIGETVKAGIPILRNTLDVDRSPLFAGEKKTTPAIKEVQRLGMRLSGVNQSPKERPEQFAERRAKVIPVMQKELNTLVETDAYKALNDREKREALQKKLDDIRNDYESQQPRGPREARKPREQRVQRQFQ